MTLPSIRQNAETAEKIDPDPATGSKVAARRNALEFVRVP
jgi:hypothetical protein